MADRPETVTGLSPAVARLQQRVQSAVVDRRRSPFEGGREVTYEFDADAGKIQIRRIHGLDRKPNGWFVTDVESDNKLDAFSFVRTESTKRYLELQLITQNGTGFYKAKVWVY